MCVHAYACIMGTYVCVIPEAFSFSSLSSPPHNATPQAGRSPGNAGAEN